MAAVLACAPGALASHRTALGIWELAPDNRRTVDVTAPGRGGHTRRGIVLHRPRCLHPEDRAVRDGIPVTSVARTVLDVAATLDDRRVERVLEAAERSQLFDGRALGRICERNRRHPGCGRLRRVLGDLADPGVTRSELERDFLDLCRDFGIPKPETNAMVEGYEVDAVWRDAGLIIELDSWRFHRTRAAFERDRARDEALELARFRVVRVTGRRMRARADLASAVRTLRERALRERALLG